MPTEGRGWVHVAVPLQVLEDTLIFIIDDSCMVSFFPYQV
jgi:hypothetical protein